MFALSFGEGLWLLVIGFLFVTYLMMLFSVIADLFRDRETRGVTKALWLVALLLFPLVTLICYVLVRGAAMGERSARDHREAQAAADEYIREVAGRNPAQELAAASDLLDRGRLTAIEYDALKAKILAT
jgi:membrane protein required for beta-lactamase induction